MIRPALVMMAALAVATAGCTFPVVDVYNGVHERAGQCRDAHVRVALVQAATKGMNGSVQLNVWNLESQPIQLSLFRVNLAATNLSASLNIGLEQQANSTVNIPFPWQIVAAASHFPAWESFEIGYRAANEEAVMVCSLAGDNAPEAFQ